MARPAGGTGAFVNIGHGDRRQTILLVDADSHARKTLRLALEDDGFSVGEACNTLEGERTARRIRPNAILADLMTDAANHGATLPERLHAAGLAIPVYIVTSGSDAVINSIGLHELGVAGVFLKPADPSIILATLKIRLASGPRQDTHA
jgi:DNA-binding response OmpR family regulator